MKCFNKKRGRETKGTEIDFEIQVAAQQKEQIAKGYFLSKYF